MRRIYLDNNSTTPTDPRVVGAMLPYFTERFGNPHSDSHSFGWEAHEAIECARKQVAALIGADAREIVFTSGATESCSIALRGVCGRSSSARNKIVTVATEHSCILETFDALRHTGFRVAVIPVDADGTVDLEALASVVDDQTLLVSVMLANNEIGVIQPVQKIAEICKGAGALLHTDATQAVGKIPVDVRTLGVDFLSCSAHKLYGPKGIGSLYVRWEAFDHLCPITTGGHQEGGTRPGTVPVPLVVGFGKAAEIALRELESDSVRSKQLADSLERILRVQAPLLQVYGHRTRRLPGNLNIGFPGVSGESVVDRVGEHLAVSTGSACNSAHKQLSHVLAAIDPDGDAAYQGVRIGIGRFNDERDIESAADILMQAVTL